MRIRQREIGPHRDPYLIAEIGVNHDGMVDRALALTQIAAEAGCDAVKLQLFKADLLMSSAARLATYQETAGETDPHAMLRRLEMTQDAMTRVVDLAHTAGMAAIVTCFSVELVAIAQTLDFDAYKTASPDIVHKPLLDALLATGKPLIVSTGASTIEEVQSALTWLAPAHDRMALLQCVSSYPTRPDQAAMEAMADLRRVFSGPVGYSDHTAQADTACKAVLMGACVLEKHITLDRTLEGPDHAASLEPPGLRRYVKEAAEGYRIRAANPPYRDKIDAKAEAKGRKVVLDCERDVRTVSRQSIVTRRPLPQGHRLGVEDLTFKRPGTGILPFRIHEVVGRTLNKPLAADALVMEADLA